MCGIAGIFNFETRTHHTEAIRRMTRRLAHRGPDAEGFYTDDYVALGHRRLSIIDVSEAANQPLWDHSGRYAIVFNGEIFNYREIRKDFTSYPFQTSSDSETILATYARFGPKCLQYLNGQFAFAIYDRTEHSLFVARDRVGEKPFYYAQATGCFIFSSEVRSILDSGMIKPELEVNHIPEFLMYQAAMGANTMVRGIQRLQAGHYALLQGNRFDEVAYWGFESIEKKEPEARPKERIRELFMDSVRLQMIADVPLGAFLSGGIDSSLIVACMAGLSDQPVNTFTISFDEKAFDESAFAQTMATRFNTRHHRILIRPEEFLDSVEDILAAMDTPSGDGPNTYLVAKYTRQEGIKVALSGLGGDELFAGYNKFILYHRLMRKRWMLRFPRFLRHRLATALLSLEPGHKSNKLAYLMDQEEWNLSTVYPLLRRSYSAEEIQKILPGSYPQDAVARRLADLEDKIQWMGDFSQCTVAEMETYTRDVLLRDTDQMSMAHALEVRVPFFDHRLIEYVLSLPDDIKYPHTPKQLLVDSFPGMLPPEITRRKKMGFSFPMEAWLRNELSSMAERKIQFLAERKEFQATALLQKWARFKQGDQRILWTRIWKLVVLADWIERRGL